MVYVPGNHDRWSARLERVNHDEHDENGREVAARYGIDWLDRGSVEVGGVTVHGCTLWSDLRLGYGDLGHSTGMARRGMNDYRRIRRRPSGRHHYIRPEDTREWHRRDLAWLDGALTTPDGLPRPRPAVVVTHHAPSPQCLADPWDPLRHCYASDLRQFIERHRPDLWIHGHVHHHVDHREGLDAPRRQRAGPRRRGGRLAARPDRRGGRRRRGRHRGCASPRVTGAPTAAPSRAAARCGRVPAAGRPGIRCSHPPPGAMAAGDARGLRRRRGRGPPRRANSSDPSGASPKGGMPCGTRTRSVRSARAGRSSLPSAGRSVIGLRRPPGSHAGP